MASVDIFANNIMNMVTNNHMVIIIINTIAYN